MSQLYRNPKAFICSEKCPFSCNIDQIINKFDFTEDCDKKWTIWKQVFEFFLKVTVLSETEDDVQKVTNIRHKQILNIPNGIID